MFFHPWLSPSLLARCIRLAKGYLAERTPPKCCLSVDCVLLCHLSATKLKKAWWTNHKKIKTMMNYISMKSRQKKSIAGIAQLMDNIILLHVCWFMSNQFFSLFELEMCIAILKKVMLVLLLNSLITCWIFVERDGQFYQWFDLSHDGDFHVSDTSCSESRLASRAESPSVIFCGLVH